MQSKIVYIIPALGDSCSLQKYQKIGSVFILKGYKVNYINPDWYKPLSGEIFKVEKNAVLFGFSFGAVLAYLIAKKYPCRKVFFASLSPIHSFSYKSLVKDFSEHMSKEKAEELSADIKKIKVNLGSLKTPYVTIAGELEKLAKGEKVADILVPKTGHQINSHYLNALNKILE
jgi:esterase/lipase